MKMLKGIFSVFNLILCIVFFASPSYAFDNGDFQYWNTESVEVKLKENWKFKVDEEFRFGDNSSSFYYTHTDAGLNYLFNKNLDFNINYRQIFQKNKNSWDLEYRPHVSGTVKAEWRDFAFKNRSRFEYRIQEYKSDSWRYRNRSSIDLPFRWTSLNIRPYVADEIFVDFDKKELNTNRAYMGFTMKFLKNLNGDIYYMLQSAKSGKWKTYNVFGTSLKLVF
ncbi:MAG: hypothetical protein A2Z72_07880 [Omnitrophica bacterium RBG_13_46_9]|nr:MAG: hypothetical protein A2Z72_07880 [Omnitrophica bacterium RBG_13_46_9]